jgi:CheY-like chemotaxis protein
MDDDEAIRKIYAILLERLGYGVDAVACGEEAIERFQEAGREGVPYRAVILDLNVEAGMGGLETLKQLRALDPHVYCIVASGSSREATAAEAHSHGFNDVLPKPFRLQEVMDCVSRLGPPQ